jgi:hypothetical protein
VYPEGTDLARPDKYEETREVNALTQAIQEKIEKASTRSTLLISSLLGIVIIACIIYLFIKKKSKS